MIGKLMNEEVSLDDDEIFSCCCDCKLCRTRIFMCGFLLR